MDWQDVHRALGRVAAEKAALDAEELYWIRMGHVRKVWAKTGHATFAEYLERVLGIDRKTARERIRTALALGDLPVMTEALSEGRLAWTAVRELSRVATGETEEIWIQAAEGQTVRQIEEMVSGLEGGDLPGAVRDRSNETRVLRFEVSNATYAAFREAANALMQRSGHQLADDELIGMMARAALADGEAGDGRRANYQLAYQRCPDCETTSAEGAGREVEVDAATAAMIDCDAQVIDTSHVERAAQTVTPARRQAVLRSYRGCCAVPGCGNAAFLDIHHIEHRARGGTNEMDNLIPLCGAHHRALHDDLIKVERRGERIVVTYADGTAYGHLFGGRRQPEQAHRARPF